MKTIIIILSFLFLVNGKEASAQKKIKFYYYPAANVYYNTTTATYSYIENNSWVSAPYLPAAYVIKHSPRQVIFHPNAQVWNNNYNHRMHYAPEPKVMDAGYKETNSQQAKGSLLNGNLIKRKGKL
ncbi:MAG: hypothetical protein ACR2KB_02840 [Chitinophagaceae bacterium]